MRWNEDEDKVYAAVVVVDNKRVYEVAPIANWNSCDRIEIYAQGDPNGGKDWGAAEADDSKFFNKAQQYAVGPTGGFPPSGHKWVTWGDGSNVQGGEGPDSAFFESALVLDPSLAFLPGTYIYEIGAKMFLWYGGRTAGAEATQVRQLVPGNQVGFDVIVDSRWGNTPHDDPEEFGMLSDNMMTGKYIDAAKFQRWELLNASGQTVEGICGDWGILAADVVVDCEVNLKDFVELSGTWTDCTSPEPPCSYLP